MNFRERVGSLQSKKFVAKSTTYFSEMRGGVRGRLEVFRKFIEFGPGNAPLLIPAVTKMVQHTQLLTNREMLQDNVAGQLQISKYSMLIVRTQ